MIFLELSFTDVVDGFLDRRDWSCDKTCGERVQHVIIPLTSFDIMCMSTCGLDTTTGTWHQMPQ